MRLAAALAALALAATYTAAAPVPAALYAQDYSADSAVAAQCDPEADFCGEPACSDTAPDLDLCMDTTDPAPDSLDLDGRALPPTYTPATAPAALPTARTGAAPALPAAVALATRPAARVATPSIWGL